MRLLITGANGLLGQKLSSLLQNRGIDFLATSKAVNRNPELSDRFFKSLDVTNLEELTEIVRDCKPSAIINTAAMTNVDQCEHDRDGCWRMNVTAVENLIQTCQRFQAKLIHLSTDFIFDGLNGPYSEGDDPNPVSYYGESKLEGERLIQESGIDWAIIRTILVYGVTPNMSRSNIILWVKESLEEGKRLKIVNDQWRTPTLAEDLAAGCWLVAENDGKGIFHISGNEMLTPFEMAWKTAEFFNLDSSLIEMVDSTTFSQPAKRPPKTGFEIKKAKEVLGYVPHSFEEGLSILKSQLEKVV